MSKHGPGLAAGILLLSALASPAQGEDVARSGIFIGLGGSYAIDVALEDELPAGLRLQNSWGLQARLGYRLLPRLAVEAQLEYLHDFDLRALDAQGDWKKISEHSLLAATMNAKLFLRTGDVQPFLLAGAGILYANLDDSVGAGVSVDGSGAAVRAGGGFDIYVAENVVTSLDATYVLPFGKVAHFGYVSIGFGVQYRF